MSYLHIIPPGCFYRNAMLHIHIFLMLEWYLSQKSSQPQIIEANIGLQQCIYTHFSGGHCPSLLSDVLKRCISKLCTVLSVYGVYRDIIHFKLYTLLRVYAVYKSSLHYSIFAESVSLVLLIFTTSCSAICRVRHSIAVLSLNNFGFRFSPLSCCLSS